MPFRALGSFEKHGQQLVLEIGQTLAGEELLEGEVIEARGVVSTPQKQAALRQEFLARRHSCRVALLLGGTLIEVLAQNSIERFESLTTPGKILSLSFWRDEEAVEQWRNLSEHREVQRVARQSIFQQYRIRVARVLRDYGMNERSEAPEDSKMR